jgi:hypothetical protein
MGVRCGKIHLNQLDPQTGIMCRGASGGLFGPVAAVVQNDNDIQTATMARLPGLFAQSLYQRWNPLFLVAGRNCNDRGPIGITIAWYKAGLTIRGSTWIEGLQTHRRETP